MKKYLLPFILLFLLSCTDNQIETVNSPNDMELMNLKSNVTAIEEMHYNAIIKFENVEKSIADSSRTYSFNENGYISESRIKYIPQNYTKISRFTYSSSNKITEINYLRDNNRLLEKYKFAYNNFDELSDINYYYSDGALNMRWDLFYNLKKYLKTKNEYDDDGKLLKKYTYRCNGKGLIIKELTFNPDLTIEMQTTYNYDMNSNIIQKSIFGMDGRSYIKWVYEYQEDGKLKSEAYFDQRQAVLRFYTRKSVFTYNENGDMTGKEVYNSERMLSETWKYVYTYDNKNNWISQIQSVNSVPKKIIDRIITYKK